MDSETVEPEESPAAAMVAEASQGSPPLRRSKRPSPSPHTQSPPVYLCRETASGQAGARLESNHVTFMQLMGLVDNVICEEGEGVEWESSLSDRTATLLMTAGRHRYYPSVRKEGVNDGFLYDEYIDECIGKYYGIAADVPQCTCVAHEHLKHGERTETQDLVTIIRSASPLTMDSGASYACALLRRIFHAMGLSTLKPERSGGEFGVSYTLECDGSKYVFRGHPDFVVQKDVGAGRILVATGELQSTNQPHLQNSIYGVASLQRDNGRRPILALTIFKNKNAQLAVAPTPSQGEAVVGFKYVVSPSPMDLNTVDGLKTLAACLSHMLAK